MSDNALSALPTLTVAQAKAICEILYPIIGNPAVKSHEINSSETLSEKGNSTASPIDFLFSDKGSGPHCE